jgi:ATP-dependent Clp protease, protease subunit
MQNSQPYGFQLFDELLKQRIVFLGSEVTDESANTLCAQLLLLSADDPVRDIQFYINSPGGSVSAGLAVYDTMRFIPNDVATIGIGMAGSMGQFLLTAGSAGKRYALPHARIMMHQASGGIGGSSADIMIQAENMLFVKRQMHELIALHSGRPVAEIAADSDRDRWFTAEQARDYGLIDAVITEPAAVPALPASR